jgi:hypothetical protein
MLPKIDLPDLLFEVHAWTGFLDAFVHLGDGTTRMKDLSTSVVAPLVSEACNIGLAPVVNPGYEALTRARLVHVDQYYLRADTTAVANARLIEAQAAVPIVKFRGEGLLASVRVNLNKVITQWPDMLKVAGSLVTNQVRAYDLLRMFGREGRPTPLGAAFAEYGRIAKTEHLLRVVDPVDDTYRRQMNRQLTVQESRPTSWPGTCVTASAAPSTRRTATAWRTSSARSAWSSTPSCSGPPATSTPPSPS